MHCPKDNLICKTQRLDDVEVDICPRCQGVWIEKREVKKIVQNLSVPKYSNADELIAEWETTEKYIEPKDFWIEDKLECPKGHGHMSKHYFAGSHIGVDQCKECQGLWLDGGEMKAVARYVSPNPELDSALIEYTRDKKEFNKKLEEMAGLPAAIASYALMVKSMPIVFALAGGFLVKLIVDAVVRADHSAGRY